MHLRPLDKRNAKNAYLTENLHGDSLSVLGYQQEQIISVVEQYFKLDPRFESTTLSTTECSIILSAHHWVDKSVEM